MLFAALLALMMLAVVTSPRVPSSGACVISWTPVADGSCRPDIDRLADDSRSGDYVHGRHIEGRRSCRSIHYDAAAVEHQLASWGPGESPRTLQSASGRPQAQRARMRLGPSTVEVLPQTRSTTF